MTRVGPTTVSLPLVIAVTLLGSIGERAKANPVYQLTDLGPLASSGRLAAAGSPGFIVDANASNPLRIDNSGTITKGRLESLIQDPAILDGIDAPTAPILYAGLYPAVGGSQYRAGFVVTRGVAEPWQAMVWDGNAGKALGPYPGPTAWPDLQLPTHQDGSWFSVAEGVNDRGYVVGRIGSSMTTSAAYAWGPTQDESDPLGLIRSQLGTYSKAVGINNRDQMVGVFHSFDDPRAFLFNGTDLIDLNLAVRDSAGLRLLAATGINDQGQIVGLAIDPDGNAHEYLLTPLPVPEPSTLVLFGLASALLVFHSARGNGRAGV